MCSSQIEINLPAWISRAAPDTPNQAQRQVIAITLLAISMAPNLVRNLYLKGGMLMGLAYGSLRQTNDIDFSVSSDCLAVAETSSEWKSDLDAALPRAAASLGHTDMIVKVQSVKELPPKRYPNASFPALKIRIGYATRNSSQHKLLNEGQAADVIRLDITFNEKTFQTQVLNLRKGQTLLAYSLIDLIAEKYRALLEQPQRRHNRRQDIYDLDILIRRPDLNTEAILRSIVQKCELKNIDPNQDLIRNPEIKTRAAADWNTLSLEVGELPDFETCFQQVVDFYRQLPWPLIGISGDFQDCDR